MGVIEKELEAAIGAWGNSDRGSLFMDYYECLTRAVHKTTNLGQICERMQ